MMMFLWIRPLVLARPCASGSGRRRAIPGPGNAPGSARRSRPAPSGRRLAHLRRLHRRAVDDATPRSACAGARSASSIRTVETGRYRAPPAPRPDRIGRAVARGRPCCGAIRSCSPSVKSFCRSSCARLYCAGSPRSGPWYHPWSVSKRPTEYHSPRPHETEGTGYAS